MIALKRFKPVKVLSITLCLTVLFCAASTNAEQAESKTPLPIIMYHHLSENPKTLGDYVLAPSALERDLKYLKENGYTTLTSKQLLQIKSGNSQFPKKPCVITFDDGFLSVAEYALPLLKKYNMTAVITVIGKEVKHYSEVDDTNLEYAYLNRSALKALYSDGTLDIQCHTYDMHKLWPRKGCDKLNSESSGEYSEALKKDIESFEKEYFSAIGEKPTAVALPFGAYCDETVKNLEQLGFEIIFTCTEKVNFIEDNNSILLLGRYNRPSGTTTESFFEKIETDIKKAS